MLTVKVPSTCKSRRDDKTDKRIMPRRDKPNEPPFKLQTRRAMKFASETTFTFGFVRSDMSRGGVAPLSVEVVKGQRQELQFELGIWNSNER